MKVNGEDSNRYSAHNMAKPVNFYCRAVGARSVRLVGDFNGWDPAANPMRRRPDGTWFVQVPLHHGHHRYLFMVDGVPQLDPKATGVTRDSGTGPFSIIAVS